LLNCAGCAREHISGITVTSRVTCRGEFTCHRQCTRVSERCLLPSCSLPYWSGGHVLVSRAASAWPEPSARQKQQRQHLPAPHWAANMAAASVATASSAAGGSILGGGAGARGSRRGHQLSLFAIGADARRGTFGALHAVNKKASPACGHATAGAASRVSRPASLMASSSFADLPHERYVCLHSTCLLSRGGVQRGCDAAAARAYHPSWMCHSSCCEDCSAAHRLCCPHASAGGRHCTYTSFCRSSAVARTPPPPPVAAVRARKRCAVHRRHSRSLGPVDVIPLHERTCRLAALKEGLRRRGVSRIAA
jgi:hypothetical protein